MSKISLQIILFSILIIACGPSSTTDGDKTTNSSPEAEQEVTPRTFNVSTYKEVNEAYGELMTAHDEMMEFSSKVKLSTLKMEEARDNLQLMGNKPKGLLLVQKLIDDLDTSDDAMMDWMRNLKSDYEGVDKKEALENIAIEKANILDIGKQMEIAIFKAKTNAQKIYQIK